ncbi:MAG: ABC transporter permease [Phycisphaerae bacterium]
MNWLYKLQDILRLGFHSLTIHKVRSALTSLGIIIGVAGVIVMLAINEGMSLKAQQALRELGSNNIIIHSVKPPTQSSGASEEGQGVFHYGLTRKDIDILTNNVPGIKRCVITHTTRKYAHFGRKHLPATIIATESNYDKVARLQVTGRFLNRLDSLYSKSHCIVTASLAKKLFGYAAPNDQTIFIAEKPFTVIGTMPELPAVLAGEGGSASESIIIPLSTDRKQFGEFTTMFERGNYSRERVEISQCILQMENEHQVVNASAVAENLLNRLHDQQDYKIIVPLKLIQQQQKQRMLWNAMFFLIAAVSLIVGGIGIMNIMLASVTERTREIGVRRALGAKRTDITVQFLVEAVTLTIVGGLVGIGVGVGLPFLAAKPLKIEPIISWFTLVVPFVLAVLVGLISGLYPALRAARLDPIEALRHE